ncbi:MAG: AAA family ATPase, partial [Tumebacillaceae bacterium]
SKGRTVDFRNTVIIMTSNVGASTIRKGGALGFTTSKEADYTDMKDRVMDELKKQFRPEFLNRIDDSIVFHPLAEEHIREIVDLMSDDLKKRLRENDIHFALTDEAKSFLAKEGYDPQYGARPLKRAIQRHIEDQLSEALLSGTVKRGDHVLIDSEDGKLTVKNNTSPQATA